MTPTETEKVHELIRREIPAARTAPALTADLHLRDDLAAVDLDVLQIVIDLEDTFEITITDDEIEGLHTVGAVEALVASKIQAQAA